MDVTTSADNQKKILILGASSYVGRHLLARIGYRRVIATYCRSPIPNGRYFNSVSMKLADIIEKPNEILCAVILLGDTDPETCAADTRESQRINVDSIKLLLNELKGWHIKPIFTSSEFVFDGRKGDYVETDPPNPILTYGRQKVEIEKYLQDNFEEFIILRLAKVFGSELNDMTIFSKWVRDIRKDSVISCAADQVFSPVYVDDLVEGMIKVIDRQVNGIFHLAGEKSFARIDLLKMLLSYCRKYLPHEVTVIPKSINDFNLREKRPLNVSMKPDKLVNTVKLKLSDVEDICRRITMRAFGTNEPEKPKTEAEQ